MAGVFTMVAASDPVSNEVIQYPLMTRKEGRDERERGGVVVGGGGGEGWKKEKGGEGLEF